MTQRNQLVQIALNEAGYLEGTNNDTKYGTWYGLPNQPWCAMFISWCAHQAAISSSVIPKFAECNTGRNFFKNKNLYVEGQAYGAAPVPRPGDIVFFGARSSDTTHTGIVESLSGNILYTIEGNTSDMVARRTYQMTSTYILGFGLPGYEDDTTSEKPDTPSTAYNEITYTIIAGDTLYKIASQYGLTYQTLAEYNKITNVDKISVGQIINIPIKTHTVSSGDTLWSIAAANLGNGNRYSEIKSLNNLTVDLIHPGQILKLPF